VVGLGPAGHEAGLLVHGGEHDAGDVAKVVHRRVDRSRVAQVYRAVLDR
jgi:hypothetical protein